MLEELSAPQAETDWFLHMLCHGLDVVAPDAVVENIHVANYSCASENAIALREYLDSEVKAGHLLRTKVGVGPTPARTVPIAFIPKPGQPGKFRLISDASAPEGHSINGTSPPAPHFKMVTPADVFARSDVDSWGALTDVEAAFRNLPLFLYHAGLLAVEVDGYYYWELRAPFGWTLAPFSWSRVSSLIQRYCAFHGHNIVVYVDDFLCLGQSEEAANKSQDFLKTLLYSLGLKDKPSKEARAARRVTFVGFVFDFPSLSISISPTRANDIIESIESVLKSKVVYPSVLRSLAGKLTFVSQVVLGGRTFVRRIYDACSDSVKAIPVTNLLTADLKWWIRYLNTFNGQNFVHWSKLRPEVHLTTDASNLAACGTCPTSGNWVHAWTKPQTLMHINVKELWAVYRSLTLWAHAWRNHDVSFAIDNTSVVSWINSSTSHSPPAMKILRKIFWLIVPLNIRLRAVWIPTDLNVAADAGSRLLFSELQAFTSIPHANVHLSGSLSVLKSANPLSVLPCAASDHLQTLLKLKFPWRNGQHRVYKPHWLRPPSLLTEVDGSPSYGFAWPTNGLPPSLPKSCLSVLLLGCGSTTTPTRPLDPTLVHSLHSTSLSALRFPCLKPITQSWEDACAEFDALSKDLRVRLTLPSLSWSNSESLSTSTHSSTWHSGRRCVWVSSASFDPGTWFRSLKDLGNQALTSHVAMSVLLSGVRSYTFVSRKQANSMVLPSKSPFRTFQARTSAPSQPSAVCSLASLQTPLLHSSHTELESGLLIPSSETSSELSLTSVTSTLMTTDATAPVVGATFACVSGGSDYHIKLQGLWKSDAYLRYLHLSLDQRWSLPIAMGNAARELVK